MPKTRRHGTFPFFTLGRRQLKERSGMRREMENMKSRYKAVLFDFDGTLADTSEGIFKSLQYAFEADGKPSPPLSTLRKFIGPPIYDSFQTLFGYPDDKIGFMVEKYRERYRERGWREARVYDGIPELLRTLRESGVKTATASSKPTPYIEQILREQGLIQYVDYVGGASFDEKSADKAEIMRNAMRALGVSSADTVMVGDRLYDICGAKAAGLPCIAVLYGFGSRKEFEEYGADHTAETPADVQKLIFED